MPNIENIRKDALPKAAAWLQEHYNIDEHFEVTYYKVSDDDIILDLKGPKGITIKAGLPFNLLYPAPAAPPGQGDLWPDKPSDLYVGDQNGVLQTPADRGEPQESEPESEPAPGCDTCVNRCLGLATGCKIKAADEAAECNEENGFALYEAEAAPETEALPCHTCDYWGDKLDPDTDQPVRDVDGEVIQACTCIFTEGEECGPDNGYKDYFNSEEAEQDGDDEAVSVDGGDHDADPDGEGGDEPIPY